MRKQFLGLSLLLLAAGGVFAQGQPLSQQLAATAMNKWKDSLVVGSSKDGTARWHYQESVVLRGMEEIYKTTGDKKYFDYIKRHVDYYVNEDGSIRTYKQDEYSIDNIPMGRLVLFLYQATGEEKYRKAAQLVNQQLEGMPRTLEGGLWHKAIYPWQMWLDGLYMGQPFNAEYAKIFRKDPKTYDDLVNQFVWMEKHTRDEKTGLLYHAWDESKGMKWADEKTGRSPHFWSRAIGWYAMALVDAPDFMPEGHPGRQQLKAILQRTAEGIRRYQDPATGVWWQITDSINARGNYMESSGSCMFVYALAKGVRLGLLPASYMETAKKGLEGIRKQFLETGAGGQLNLKNTCRGAGLGNNPYRDGSYRYYLSEPVVTNDAHGVGAFLLMANEMEKAAK
ncbi:glycoside hydrolase family 88 protein [Paraflavisolibacter sp. H34]|uniref:glycoside hydrolase family 88/105 protein n=1 Tax=Huijunlia imazamoxiresistens TaxID=3127457 RepID=UPI0030164324